MNTHKHLTIHEGVLFLEASEVFGSKKAAHVQEQNYGDN